MISPIFDIDFYKAGHIYQYPEGTEFIQSNLTPRSGRLFKGSKFYDDKVVVVGLQMVIQEYLIDTWKKDFFDLDLADIEAAYQETMDESLGAGAVGIDHIKELWQLGYLPIRIQAVPEGERVPFRVPVLTIENTKPGFFWLVNYLESVLSSELWQSMTSATIAYEFKRILEDAAERTGCPKEGVAIQAHDFSFRGMSSRQSAIKSGIGHLTSFIGTDCVPAIPAIKKYYGMSERNQLPIGVSVPATEHSVMCMGQEENEFETYRRLIEDIYPSGIVSIVSDTWDYWNVVTNIIPALKDKIMARTPNELGLNKVVIRPDSGDPVKIICGYITATEEFWMKGVRAEAVEIQGRFYLVESLVDYLNNGTLDNAVELSEVEVKGSIECLWETFGGTNTETGHKLLDEHIGLIYGDSITLERCQEICDRLAEKGFASQNVVFGIGSFTYQYNTRDTLGFAVKATWGVVDGVSRDIQKTPKTDSGTKHSAKGYLVVTKDIFTGEYKLGTEDDWVQRATDLVFQNGTVYNRTTFDEIRNRLV